MSSYRWKHFVSMATSSSCLNVELLTYKTFHSVQDQEKLWDVNLSVCCSVCILFAHMLHLIKCVTERCLSCFKYITTLSDPTRAWQVASCYRCVFFPPRRHTGHQTVWSMDLDVAVCKPERKKPAGGTRFASGETLQTFFSLIPNVPHRTLQDDL